MPLCRQYYLIRSFPTIGTNISTNRKTLFPSIGGHYFHQQEDIISTNRKTLFPPIGRHYFHQQESISFWYTIQSAPSSHFIPAKYKIYTNRETLWFSTIQSEPIRADQPVYSSQSQKIRNFLTCLFNTILHQQGDIMFQYYPIRADQKVLNSQSQEGPNFLTYSLI